MRTRSRKDDTSVRSSGLSAESLVEKIRADVEQGYRFVALVGAGLSVASGFPLVNDLKERYLRYCILRALKLNPLAQDSKYLVEIHLPRWDPRSGDWPSMNAEVADIWSRTGKYTPLNHEQFDRVLEWAFEAVIDDPQSYPWLSKGLVAQARMHAPDWRRSLHFLSSLVWRRVTVDKGEYKYPQEWLEMTGDSDRAVIDSCFHYLLRGCEPALSHQMLVALCPVLRINAIVSTNFDDLIERAFAAVPSPLTVFEVPAPVPLPAAGLVRNQRTLIKMNGGNFGLRADATIDESDPRDRENFVGYLAGQALQRDPTEEKQRTEFEDEPVAILVSGVGGRESRTTEMLRHAVKVLPKLHIFWIGFSEMDPALPERIGCRDLETGQINRGFHYLPHREHGLLFLQIYQACAQSIPTTGVLFPGLWQIPFPPLIPLTPHSREKVIRRVRLVGKRIVGQLMTSDRRRPVVVYFSKNHRGAMTISAQIFAKGLGETCPATLNPRFVWIDLEQVARPVGLFLRLVQLAARQAGESDPVSALDYAVFEHRHRDRAGYRNFCQALRRVLRDYHVRLGQPLVVFVNVQEGAGTYPSLSLQPGSWPQARSPKAEFRWDEKWTNPVEITQLVELIQEVNEDASCGVQFVFFFRAKSTASQSKSAAPLLEKMRALCAPRHLVRIGEGCTAFDESRACAAAMHWAKKKRGREKVERLAFLYLLTLFRHVRYPAGLLRCAARDREKEELAQRWSANGEPAGHSSSEDLEVLAGKLSPSAMKRPGSFLVTLGKLKVLRWQTGGLVWMSSTLKPRLQKRIRSTLHGDPWAKRELSIEGLVARWYGRLLLASADPLAGVESIHHALHGIGVFVKKVEKANHANWNQACVMLKHARLVLDIARPLFVRRVSEQFSDAALEHLQERARELLAFLQDLPGTAHPQTLSNLRHLYWEIAHVRSETYLNEAEYAKLAGVSLLEETHLDESEATAFQHHNLTLELDKAAGLIFQRRHREAAGALLQLWQTQIDGLPRGTKDHSDKYFGEIWRDPERAHGAQAAQNWLQKKPDEKVCCFAVRLARCWTLWHLNDGEIEFLWKRECTPSGQRQAADRQAEIERPKSLERALWFADFGLELLRATPSIAGRFIFEENVRLRAHAALCHGHLARAQHDGPKPAPNLMRRSHMLLADASAYVDEFPFREAGVNRAIINLRRAEVSLGSVHGEHWFRHLRHEIFNFGRDSSSQKSLLGLLDAMRHARADKNLAAHFRNRFQADNFPARQLGHVDGLLYDALVRLDRAEAELRHHPKSRWWWWTLCVLKTRLGEYLHVLRIAYVLSGAGKKLVIPLRIYRYHRAEVYSDVGTKLIRDPFFLARLIASLESIIFCEILHFNLRTSEIRTRGTGGEQQAANDLKYEYIRLADSGRCLHDLATRVREILRQAAKLPEMQHLHQYVTECCGRAEKLADSLKARSVRKRP